MQSGEKSTFQDAGICCPGGRPWLGEGAAEANCTEPLVGALINQTNIYFPRTVSAITLPDMQLQDDEVARVRAAIEQDPAIIGVAKTLWNMGERADAVSLMGIRLQQQAICSGPEKIGAALESLFAASADTLPSGAAPSAPESEMVRFRREEFNILGNEINSPEHVPNLRIIGTRVPEALAPWLGRVNLVERLREVRAFYGFDRLQQDAAPLAGMPGTALNQLFRTLPTQGQDCWLPAVEVFGEGIYVEIREDRILEWQCQQADWIYKRLDDGFVTRLAGEFLTLPPLTAADRAWACRYLLVHSLAHILINELVFECGYSTASLRERLYISTDAAAPMAAFLIYTAAGDSEGTLGGLVRLGRPERLGPVFHRALGRASWCSADPVCSEHLGGQGSRLANLAACHACVLLPETSCETINHGLDRAMVVGTPESRESGFMSELLEGAFALG